MLRPLSKSDMPQLIVIEQTAHAVPWTDETFKACFQMGYTGWVVEENRKIHGFIIVSVRVEECHILNLCVAREYQRQGLGCALLEQTLSQMRQQGVGMVYLEVRRSNTRAITLYKKQQFHCIGERKNYYPIVSGHEDALIFAKSLCEERR